MLKKYIAVAALFFIAACSNSYQKDIRTHIQNKDIPEEYYSKIANDDKEDKDYLYDNQTLASIAIFDNNEDIALESLNKVIEHYQKKELDSTIVNEVVSSIATSPRRSNYTGNHMERNMFNLYRSMLYLQQGDINKALIDVRAAHEGNLFARADERSYLKRFEGEDYSNKYGIGIKTTPYLRTIVNPYSYYISGNIREIAGDTSGALIDYKLAFELNPDNDQIISDLLRLSQVQDRSYYSTLMNSKKSQQLQKLHISQSSYRKQAKVLVVYNMNFIPLKTSNITFVPFGDSVISVNVPIYDYPEKDKKVFISSNNSKRKEVSEIANLHDMATYYLEAEVLKTIAAEVARQKLYQEGLSVLLGADIRIPIPIEPDFRAAFLLPQSIKVKKIYSDKAINNISISDDSKTIFTYKGNVKPGEILILNIMDTGKAIYYQEAKF